MSIEQTLQNIADALLKVAEANQAIAAASLKTEESYRASIGAYAAATANSGTPLFSLSVDAELDKAVTKVETEAKAQQQKVMAQVEADRKPSAAKEAITKALADAKAEKEAAAPAPVVEEDDPLADSTPLDYEKDVKPKLVAVGKNKQEMVDLLASFGVGKDLTYAKADMLPADKFGAVVAACDKILAARG